MEAIEGFQEILACHDCIMWLQGLPRRLIDKESAYNPPITRVQPLVREDPLEKEMATHSSILAWEIPWMEEPGRPQSFGSQRIQHALVTKQRRQQCDYNEEKRGSSLKYNW